MKQRTVRMPDEGELWTSGNHNGWYAVINGKFVRLGLTELEEAIDAQRLKMALDNLFNPSQYRGFSLPEISENTYHGNGYTLRDDDYKSRVEDIVTAKLNKWSEDIRLAARSLAKVMTS